MNEISGYKRPVTEGGSIVVDLGCASYQRGDKQEDSIITLIRRFKPMLYFGFDPAVQDGVGRVEGTTLVTSRKAAWIHDGRVGFVLDGNCSHVAGDDSLVHCFDIAQFLTTLPRVDTVLKLDVEGAEYELLPHLLMRDALKNVRQLLVEWHTGKRANGYDEKLKEKILAELTVPVEEWQ